MRTRKVLSLLLAGTMMMGLLTGCWGGKKDDSSSDSGSGNSDITWTDPDYDKNKVDPAAEYAIAVNAGSNGTVSPSSPLKVKGGGSVSFTVTANAGRSITGIQIDNVDQPMKGSVEKLKVTLEKVSKNHTVTVKFTEKTYTVTASASVGGSIQYNNTVKYNGTASITATPEDLYKVASVTATMGGASATVETDGKQTYTVSKVNGDVAFTVIFEKAAIASVTLSGTPSTTTYQVGDTFKVDGLNAVIKYTNGQEKTVPLNSQNVTVTPDTLAANTEAVEIKYTRPDGVTETITYDLAKNGVKIGCLSADDKKEIWNEFYVRASNAKVGILSDEAVIKKLENAGEGTTIKDQDGIITKCFRADITSPSYKQDILPAIKAFFGENGRVDHAKQMTDKGLEGPKVYMELDTVNGACTMWVVFNTWA